ncbi:MAG: His-Xaa-Ser system radical SAM maturase HxsC [Oscillibacter sp.]|nr:His-Xaa-Ser system radical SAM maturase HxsC [Oscillibacter sp.]
MEYGRGLIVSIAKSEKALSELSGKNTLFVDSAQKIYRFFPANEQITPEPSAAALLDEIAEYDVVEFYADSNFKVLFRDDSNDNALVVTNQCNSSCIMCPCSEGSRRRPSQETAEHLCQIVEYMPTDTRYLTITGGEPTLLGRDLFPVMKKLREHFEDFTEFQFLTNGRAFSNPDYFQQFLAVIPNKINFGIPLYGYSAETHDPITQARGSFVQAVSGIRALLQHGCRVELRIVISKLNRDYMDGLARFIVSNFQGVSHIAIMATEMCGAAAANRGDVWIDYQEAFQASKNAIKLLLSGGIDVMLFNFPLCKVERGYWALCQKSISDYKIRYYDTCRSCKVRDLCGGVFRSTLRLTGMKLDPI